MSELNLFRIPEIDSALRALDAGQSPVLVSGVGAASRAQFAAAAQRALGSPLVALCPDDSAAELMRRDLEALLGRRIPLLQSRELNLYSAESASREAERRRIAVLALLAGERPDEGIRPYGGDGSSPEHRAASPDAAAAEAPAVLVATVAGLVQRCIPREALADLAFTLSVGETVSPEDVECRLLRCGYVRRESVEAPGQYARRGGILDLFTPALATPVRMEFWGDEIDSMGVFDPETQRRTENLETCSVLPAQEAIPALCQGGEEGLADALEAEASRLERRSSAAHGGQNGAPGSSRPAGQAEELRASPGASPRPTDAKAHLAAVLRADAEKLRETGALTAADRYMGLIYPRFSCALDYLPPDALVFLDQPVKCARQAEDQTKLLNEDLKSLIGAGHLAGKYADYRLPWEAALGRLAEFPCLMGDNFTQGRTEPEPRAIVGVTAKQLPSYGGNLETACDDVRHYVSTGFAVLVLVSDERRAGALRELFAQRDITADVLSDRALPLTPGKCAIAVGALSGGFEYPLSKLAVLTDAQLLRPGVRKPKRAKKTPTDRKKLESYADLSVGDLVVHEYHGIGRFAGIVQMRVDGVDKDYIKICYAGTDTLYVPATQLDLVCKYIGAGEDKPVRLSKMGGADWGRTKARAKAAAKEMAGELIALYAERRRRPGHAFAPDSPWQAEFEEAFGYEETGDQLRSIAEIKKDMESSVPMDRLLCGDVGYGKTEVALRAVMKAVLDGYQAAILVPTTVLAQ